jgi:hypothetical protein
MPKMSKWDRNFWQGQMRANQIKCEARTRAGHPCRAPAMDNGRCRMHGGLATGPNTPEGRESISRVQKSRWERYRLHRSSG